MFGAVRSVDRATDLLAGLAGVEFQEAARQISEIAALSRTSPSEVTVVATAMLQSADRLFTGTTESFSKALIEVSQKLNTGHPRFLGPRHQPIGAVLHPEQALIVIQEVIRRFRPEAWSIYLCGAPATKSEDNELRSQRIDDEPG